MGFRERVYRFMAGRHGQDQLGNFIFAVALILCLISGFTSSYVGILAILVLCYGYFRILSKNLPARYKENQWYLRRTNGIRTWIAKQRALSARNAGYRIFKCPKCKQKLRLPKGRGKIEIRCRSCGNQFIRRT